MTVPLPLPFRQTDDYNFEKYLRYMLLECHAGKTASTVARTLYLYSKRWSVSNGSIKTDQIHNRTEGGNPGSLTQ